MLKIERQSDVRAIKSILHRIADIPGGITINSASLGGDVLYEGTQAGLTANGSYEVVKTTSVVTSATADATTLEVAKGQHFKVGDYIGPDGNEGKKIVTVNKQDADKDSIVLEAALGIAIEAGATLVEKSATGTAAKVAPVAVVGTSMDVQQNDNLIVDAWLIAVVRKEALMSPAAAGSPATIIYI